MSTTAKRITAFGAAIVIIGLCLLAVSIVTLVKVYGGPSDQSISQPFTSNQQQQKQGGDDSGGGTGNGPDQKSKNGGDPWQPQKSTNLLNVAPPPVITAQLNRSDYAAYLSYAQVLNSAVNLSYDPCNNFYEYACGNFQGRPPYLELMLQNQQLLSNEFTKRGYTNKVFRPRAVKQAALLHNKCLDNASVVDPQRVDAKLAALNEQLGGVKFPAMVSASRQQQPFDRPPNGRIFAAVLGYLIYAEGLPTLVPGYVDTHWMNPHGGIPYHYFIDQPWLVYPVDFYKKMWKEHKDYYLNNTYNVLSSYASYKGVRVSDAQLKADAQAILDLEYLIATRINNQPSQQKNFSSVYNWYNVNSALTAFPLFDFVTYFGAAIPTTPYGSSKFYFVIQQPEVLNKLLQLLLVDSSDGGVVKPRTIYNYLYFRLLKANTGFLPAKESNAGGASSFLEDGEWILRETNALEYLRTQQSAFSATAINFNAIRCMRQNTRLMKHATSRAFIDAFAPDAQARQRLRSAVGGVVGRVTDAFQGMLAQLGWMSEASKQAALSKVRNLAKVIAYPEWVLDDGALDSYYASLPTFTEAYNLTAMVDALTAFNRDKDIELLSLTGVDIDRENGLHGISTMMPNAWYQGQFNSITLPLGLLQPPFFHPDYPASVNYGALGMVTGHELTHAFDDKGIQWDATGVLNTWMDSSSQAGFARMASCVVEQYSGFQPIADEPTLTINGVQTQGDSIADSGGIQAAYKAYQAYRALYGPDPQLPDEAYKWFSHDQLFFLAYAQQHCQVEASPTWQKRQLLFDSHAPSKYRVLGTLQNFPAFRTAFNCPVGSLYAPEQRCQVWVSDSEAVTSGVPSTTTSLPPPNIAPPPTNKSLAYVETAGNVEQTMDTSQSPCTNFYEYACNNYEYGRGSVDRLASELFKQRVEGLKAKPKKKDPHKHDIQIKPVRQIKQLFKQCYTALDNWTAVITEANIPAEKVQLFRNIFGPYNFSFPLFDDPDGNSTAELQWPESIVLGAATGLLSGMFETDTLVTPFIDTDWMESQANTTHPYRLFLDQASLTRSRRFYVGSTWEMFAPGYRRRVRRLLLRYANVVGATLNSTQLNSDVDDILAFEYIIANRLMTDEDTRRNFSRSYNPVNQSELASFRFVYLPMYMFLAALPSAPSEIVYRIAFGWGEPIDPILVEPARFRQYDSAFAADNPYGFTARTLYNYLHYRLIDSYSAYLPELPRSNQGGANGTALSAPYYSLLYSESPNAEEELAAELARDDNDHPGEQLFAQLEWNLQRQSRGKKKKGGQTRGELVEGAHGSTAWTRHIGDMKKEDLVTNEILHGYQRVRHFGLLSTSSGRRELPTYFEKVDLPKNLGGISEANGFNTYADYHCSRMARGWMTYASARIYLDRAYGDESQRKRLRESVGELVANVNVAFEALLAQLGWMGGRAKQEARSKIANQVRNIAYPNFVLDDALLSQYYELLNFTDPQSYLAMVEDLKHWSDSSSWALLLQQGNVNRTKFGAVDVINAWYRPDVNSITFPMGILQQPFFHPDNPASVNYAGLGVVAGHELTHGFDDRGVQWNAVGELRGWLDSSSAIGFKEMADCVVQQYGGFCPLDNNTYSPSCLDGVSTQGENIADNGGMRAAYQAYRNVIAMRGQDPQLPGSLSGQLSHDQLFFLSYAQLWCDEQPDPVYEWLQLLLDPHSPSKYRVVGPLQNFPAFRAAFNCPANVGDDSGPIAQNAISYTPEEHCNVWVDEVELVTGVPPTTTTLPPLNIPMNEWSNDSHFADAASVFATSVDIKQDPCNSFYEYSCGKFQKSRSFSGAQFRTIIDTAFALHETLDDGIQLGEEDIEKLADIPALDKVHFFYNTCRNGLPVWDELTTGSYLVRMQAAMFQYMSGFPFPLFDDALNKERIVYHFPNEFDMGFALGYLRYKGINTLMTLWVDTTWDNPMQQHRPYSLLLDQPRLLLPRSYYMGMAWEMVRPLYVNDVAKTLQKFVDATGYSEFISNGSIYSTANQIADFEVLLAREFMNDENDRRDYSRLFNPLSMNEIRENMAQTVEMFFYFYIGMRGAPEESIWEVLTDPRYRIIVNEPAKTWKLNKLLRDENRYSVGAETLYNYLYFRVIVAFAQFFGPTQGNEGQFRNVAKALGGRIHSLHHPPVGRPRWQVPFSLDTFLENEEEHTGQPVLPIVRAKTRGLNVSSESTSIGMDDIFCAYRSIRYIPYATTRLHLDYSLPRKSQRKKLQRDVDNVIENVLVGFRSMLSQLNWMSSKSLEGASAKIDQLVRNVAFPEFITDDAKLDYYYRNLVLSPYYWDFDYNLLELGAFNQKLQWDYLAIRNGTNRTDFLESPDVVNAWYAPELNSITFPWAILQKPFFDPTWPAAINYGALGVVAGHELTHAFDDQGVQWDGVGFLRQWMEKSSYSSFLRMANCVQEQYSNYCPLDPEKYQPNCVNGILTQGENIADNGGLRAAFRAYRNVLGLKGPEQQLPDNLAGQFTHDQLFFLSFAQVWCEPSFNPEHAYAQMLTDPHTPSKGRVWGAVQNFPAFRAAFNCPAGTEYTPEDHCDVWVTDVKQVTGVPHYATTLPPLNIPAPERNYTPKYQEAAQFFQDTIDTTQGPCDNFYEYACNNIYGPDVFEKLTYEAIFDVIRAYKHDNEEEIDAIEKGKRMFRRCGYAMDHPNKVLAWQQVPKDKYNLFQSKTGIFFPPLNTSYKPEWPSATTLGKAVGLMSGSLFIDTLVSAYVWPNWKDPQGAEPYLTFVDQSLLSLPSYLYSDDIWNQVYERYGYIIEKLIMQMGVYLKIDFKFDDVDNAVQDIMDFEYTVAKYFLSSESMRDNPERNYNLFTIKEAMKRFPGFDTRTYAQELSVNAPPEVRAKMANDGFKFVLMEPERLSALLAAFTDGNEWGFTPAQLSNWFYWRIIWDNYQYIYIDEGDVDYYEEEPEDELVKPTLPLYNSATKTLNASRVAKTRKVDMRKLLHYNGHGDTSGFPGASNSYSSIFGAGGTAQKGWNGEEGENPFKPFSYRLYRPKLGPPKYVPVEFSDTQPRPGDEEDDRITFDDFYCTIDMIFQLELVSDRLYVDYVQPPHGNRTKIHDGAEKLMNAVLLAFRSMINQIDWMSPVAKQGAYQKMENIVTNVAAPRYALNNTLLNDYYADLAVSEEDNYILLLESLRRFNSEKAFSYLALNRGTIRDEFGMTIIFVNAWYQPWLNSITLPASILQQPFYDPDWPAAINYGSLGMVLGHELTHGFDNSGVQWDAMGALSTWLDPSSQTAFDSMASCIINEYNRFCPLDPEDYQPNCINGNVTQGENIADNGGLHAAFRAYRGAIEVVGPERALPGDLVGQFTNDQLFFLSFARPWCEVASDRSIYRSLTSDVHSPAKYRIFGTLRNFPAFQDAFHCPKGAKYAPEKHCEVWITDISDKPMLPPPPNLVNVPTPATVMGDEDGYDAYRSALNFVKASINTSADPCNSFYEYACGSYTGPSSFVTFAQDNYERIGQALDARTSSDVSAQDVLAPTSAIQKLVNFHSMCTDTLQDMDKVTRLGAARVVKKVRDFAQQTGLTFTLFRPKQKYTRLPSAESLASALAQLSIRAGVNTFISTSTIVELVPTQPKVYKLVFDQPSLLFPSSYYQPEMLPMIREPYLANAVDVLSRFAAVVGASTSGIANYAQRLLEFEVRLAREPYSNLDATQRADYSRWKNLLSLAQANRRFDFIQWGTFFEEVAHIVGLSDQLIPAGRGAGMVTAYFPEGLRLYTLSRDLQNKTMFDPDVVVNYLFFRLIIANAPFLPKAESVVSPQSLPATNATGASKNAPNSGGYHPMHTRKPDFLTERRPQLFGPQRGGHSPLEPFLPLVDDSVRLACVEQEVSLMSSASSRIFVEQMYDGGSAEAVGGIRSASGQVAQAIRHSMRSMLDELDWLDAESRLGAFAKVDEIQVNLAFADYILDDGQLDAEYASLAFDASTDNYFTALDKLVVFNARKYYSKLLNGVDRAYFVGPAPIINAFYSPELNSITFPAGILRQPFFDPTWPASLNFGSLGTVAGHELTHAFDNGGVQWNSHGGLQSWMSNSSQMAFDQMAQCVIDQYSGFCPLSGENLQPSCLIGEQTQGENIADNGGIHAAYRAYRTHVELYGPDPQLPDHIYGQLSHDQLFFLGFAQTWCQAPLPASAMLQQLLTDAHSPNYYRVFGTIQNYPAFRSAFNCPVNATYTPAQHCSVWVPSHG